MPTATDRDLSDMAALPDDGALPLASETARAAAETEGAYEPDTARERLSQAAASLRHSAELIASRLRDGDTAGAFSEIESAIRGRPIGTVLAGAAVGFILARVLRR